MCTSKQFEYDVFEVETMLRERIASVDDISPVLDGKSFCKVCGTREIQVCLRNKNKYCKICFPPVLMHKFKATLGKSKAVRSTDSILIAHSGKVNSTVLVHLVKGNFSELDSKRIPFQCKVLYIDDGMVKGRTIEERQFIRNALAKEAETTRLLTYIVPFSEYTDNNIYQAIQPVNMSQINTTESDVTIEEIFRRLESDTAKDELLRQLRRKLIVSAARTLNCNKVFVADASVDLAVKVLGNVSTGRGSQLPFDVAFSDLRCTDVVLLRPLKDFTRDDINGYLDCCQLYPVISSEKYNYSFATSIRTIARNFVSQLDTEFYGTVPTIYRTSEKLAIKLKKLNNSKINASIDADIDADADADADTDGDANIDDDNNTCILCEMALERCCPEDGQLSVIQAKSFSKLVSTTYMNSSSSIANSKQIRSRNHMKEEKCCCLTNPSQKQSLQSYVLKKYLCYSCSLIFLDTNRTHITLPNFVLNTIRQKMHSTCLRNEISDFLL